jgi:hypothetical protein
MCCSEMLLHTLGATFSTPSVQIQTPNRAIRSKPNYSCSLTQHLSQLLSSGSATIKATDTRPLCSWRMPRLQKMLAEGKNRKKKFAIPPHHFAKLLPLKHGAPTSRHLQIYSGSPKLTLLEHTPPGAQKRIDSSWTRLPPDPKMDRE